LETDDEGEERWGYSSGEEDDEESLNQNNDSTPQSDVEFDSYAASPKSTSLPLLSADPIFGDEARIDVDLPLDELDPPPPGPPSRQIIYVSDEDNTIRFLGYETILWRQHLWRLSCVLTFGILGLLGHWFPQIWLRWVAKEKAFVDIKHGFVVVEVGFPLMMVGLGLNGVQDNIQRYGIVSFTTYQIPVSSLDGLPLTGAGFEWPSQ
jgi:cation-transporting ATPase 13A3/4/5